MKKSINIFSKEYHNDIITIPKAKKAVYHNEVNSSAGIKSSVNIYTKQPISISIINKNKEKMKFANSPYASILSSAKN